MDQPIQPHPIKTFFDTDPWRARIFFTGALWWFPFLVYGGSIYAYYGHETPPAYFRMDIIENVRWFVLTVTGPMVYASLGIAIAYILLRKIFGGKSFKNFPVIGIVINPTSAIIAFILTFMAYWGVLALLVYEGMKKFVGWARD